MTGQLRVACRGGGSSESTRVITGTGLRVTTEGLRCGKAETESSLCWRSARSGRPGLGVGSFERRLLEFEGLSKLESHDCERACVRGFGLACELPRCPGLESDEDCGRGGGGGGAEFSLCGWTAGRCADQRFVTMLRPGESSVQQSRRRGACSTFCRSFEHVASRFGTCLRRSPRASNRSTVSLCNCSRFSCQGSATGKPKQRDHMLPLGLPARPPTFHLVSKTEPPTCTRR